MKTNRTMSTASIVVICIIATASKSISRSLPLLVRLKEYATEYVAVYTLYMYLIQCYTHVYITYSRSSVIRTPLARNKNFGFG